MNPKEIEKRKAIWFALSEFYLDTELNKEEIKRIAEVFKASEFTIEEIKEINYSEVGPILIANLYVPAGVWDGFDEEWLYEQIIKNLNKKKYTIGKLFTSFYRKQISKACIDYWQAIEKEFKNNEF